MACPYCFKEVAPDAAICHHCGKALLRPKVRIPWYFGTSFIIIAFLCFGPFALLLVWLHPVYSLKKKIIITALTIVGTYLAGIIMAQCLKVISQYYKGVFS